MFDREFKSKVDWWYHLTVFVLVFITIFAFVATKDPVAMIIPLLVSLLCVHMMLNTWYRITPEGELIVHCSIFPEKKILIEEITAVEVTALPVSSYALSLDRLIIYKGKQQWMLISPNDKREFIRCLRKHNLDIQIKDPDLM